MPKIVDYEKKRRSIAETAVSVFSKKSIETATMQNIADKAGISKGSIYKYFKSKEELLNYIIITFLEGFEEIIREMDNVSMYPEDRLRLYLFKFIAAIKPFEELFITFIEVWSYNLKGEYLALKSRIDHYFNLYQQKITEINTDGQKKGTFRKEINSGNLASYLVASLDGILIHYLHNNSLYNLYEIAETFFEAMMTGVKRKCPEG